MKRRISELLCSESYISLLQSLFIAGGVGYETFHFTSNNRRIHSVRGCGLAYGELADRIGVNFVRNREWPSFGGWEMIVFCDMDGVLVNFSEGTYRAFGIPYYYSAASSKWFYYREWGVSDEEFDSVCDRQFFASLRWMHDGRQILETVEKKFNPTNIYLLTSQMNNPGSPSGKMDWILRHLPTYRKRLIITQSPKSLFAGPDRLLIDDKDENVAEFVIAGGQSILVPRPWNELHEWADKTLEAVQNTLESL